MSHAASVAATETNPTKGTARASPLIESSVVCHTSQGTGRHCIFPLRYALRLRCAGKSRIPKGPTGPENYMARRAFALINRCGERSSIGAQERRYARYLEAKTVAPEAATTT